MSCEEIIDEIVKEILADDEAAAFYVDMDRVMELVLELKRRVKK